MHSKIMFDPNIEVIKRAVKRDEMRGLSRILSLFRDKLDKFNNTGARLLGSIYCIHHIYINCWFPLYRWSVMEKQVTSTPPPNTWKWGGSGYLYLHYWPPVDREPAINVDMVNDPKTTFKSRLEIACNYALMLPYNYMRNHYGRHYIATW